MKAKKRLLTFLILLTIALTAGALCGCLDIFATKINLAFDSELVLEDTFYQYSSQEITPQVTLMHRDELVPSAYYTLTYSDNKEPGTAKVTATGKGNYYGEVVATFDIGYIYTFDVNGADEVDGELSQKIFSKEDLEVPTVGKSGYTFTNWSYNSQPVDFADSDNLPDTAEFVANFELNVYSIEYVLDGGKNSEDNKNAYTVEDVFELSAPTLSGKRFGGWFTDENFKNRIESLEGYCQDLTLYAKFVDYTYREITYAVPEGAEHIPYDLLLPETPLSTPEEQFAVIDGMDKKLVWYADSDYYVKYVFREMPDDDITVYARWEDVVPAGFLDKIDRFSAPSVTLNDYQDLVDYIDYVCFINLNVESVSINSLNWVRLNYESNNYESQIKQALNVDSFYPRMAAATYIIQGQSFKIALTSDVSEREASISATGDDGLLPQLGNIFALQSSGRGNDYDKFPIDFVEKTCEVTTSNQLFYVLSRGFRPLPTAGSDAEEIYAAFRDIMRNICDDSMSDLEKVRAIYEWLVLNVQYDYAVIDLNVNNADSYLYDAFYLEGVLNGVAVCDGFSKAFCVMCAIERIDCVRVTGESLIDGVGHAWNKVQILGEWFVSDATWGNAKANGASDEYISYQYFLFADADRAEFAKQNYTQFKAQTQFDLGLYYSYRDFQVGNYDVDVDLYIESEEELSYLFEYVVLNYKLTELSGSSFEIILDGALVERLSAELAPDDNLTNRLYNNALTL